MPTFGSALRLARRRQGLSLRGLQALVRYDFTYLGQVERGEKPGSRALAITCDDVLEENGRLLSAFGPAAVPESCCGPSTQKSTQPNPFTTALISEERADSQMLHTLPAPRRTVGDPTRWPGMDPFRSLYHGSHSSDDLTRAVHSCLTETGEALESTPNATGRRRLLRTRADAALLAGRLVLFDRWEPIAVRGYLTMACEAATEAGDDALTAAVYGHLAFVPAREHQPRASIDYLTAARRYADSSGVPALVSWVAAIEAEILGPTVRDGGQRALDRAADALSANAAAPSPAWFDFYSPARLEGFRGQVLLRTGRAAEARDALAAALRDLEPDAVKQRAVLLADVAASWVCGPELDVDQATGQALRAASELRLTGYHAAAERLGALRGRLTPWDGTSAVRALDEALSDHVA